MSALFRIAVFLGLMAAAGRCVDDPESFYPEKLIAPLPPGALGRPFGESVVVQGKVVQGPSKLEDASTEGRLLVQRINGVATQQGVVLRFDPITNREWWKGDHTLEGEKLWHEKERRLKEMRGKTFEMRGYERGEHRDYTNEEFHIIDEPVQQGGFRFRLIFQPLMMKTTAEIHFTPADFADRVAAFEGRAETRKGAGWLIGAEGWTLRVRDDAWPAEDEKRNVWAKGRVRKTPDGIWRIEPEDARLLDLADQVGKEVKLDGLAGDLNGEWWFEYRGERLYVENQKDLPGWTTELARRPLTIRGTLERAQLPDLGQIALKTDRDLREYYIVRHAGWSPLDLAWKKPAEIPKAPPLTLKYARSCGLELRPELEEFLNR